MGKHLQLVNTSTTGHDVARRAQHWQDTYYHHWRTEGRDGKESTTQHQYHANDSTCFCIDEETPVSNRQQCHSTAKNNTNASTTAASTSSRNAQQLLPHTPSYSNNNRSNANVQQLKQVGVAQGFHYNINSNNHHSNANIHEEQDIMDAQAIEDGLQGGYGKRDNNGQQDDDHYHGNKVIPGERPTEENISLHSTRTGKSTAVTASSLSMSEEDNIKELLQTSMQNYQCDLHATTRDNLLKACKAMATTKGLGGRVIEKNRERSIKSKVKKYTKNIVFKKIKFIADQEELGSLREKGAIGNIIMDYMNIQDQSKRYSWWMLYQDIVKRALDQQRSNCNIAIKEVVVGKSCSRACQSSYYSFLLHCLYYCTF